MISYGYPLTNETFRQYVSGVFQAMINSMSDTLNPTWNNLPKLTTTPATSLSINNTIEAPMRMELGSSALEQTTYTGNQLFNASAITRSGFEISNNGQTIKIPLATSGNGYYATYQLLKDLCPTLQVGDIAYLYADTNYNTINKYIQLTGTGSGLWNFGNSKTITQNDLDGGVAFYGNRYGDGETTQQVILTNFRITKIANASFEPYVGGTASPNPSYPQDIHSISGNNSVKVKDGNNANEDTYTLTLGNIEYCKIGNYEDKFIRNSGKNLFNPSDLVQGYLSNTLIDNRTTTARTDAILLKAGTYYYKFKYASEIWVKMVTYTNTTDTSGTYVFNSKSSNYSTTFTLENDTYVRFGFDETLSNITTSATIMLSNENIDYEPYGTNEWYIKKAIGKVVLDGSESWSNNGETTDYGQYVHATTDKEYGATNMICDKFISKVSPTENSIAGRNTNSSLYITIAKSIVPYGRDNFKTWLASNNTIVYYPLITPTYTQITGTLANELESIYNAMSKNGTTNISQVNNDLAFVISPTLLQDLS